MKDGTHHPLKLVSFVDGHVASEFILNKSKMILGNGQNCDIVVKDAALSFYHAIIFINTDAPDGIEITDLKSHNGVWINNNRIQNAYASIGDEIRLGSITYLVEEIQSHELKDESILEVDQTTIKIEADIPTTAGLRPIEGLTVIDNEYCDINFKDELFHPLTELKIDTSNIESSYVDPTVATPPTEGISGAKKRYIEILILSNGQIVSTHYHPLKKSTIYVSGKKKSHNTIFIDEVDLGIKNRQQLVSISHNNEITVQKIETFHFHHDGQLKNCPMKESEMLILDHHNIQILIRTTEELQGFKKPPIFAWDNDLHRNLAIGFSILLLFYVSTYFINIEPKKLEEQKQVAIIYELEQEIKVMKAEDPVNNDSNPGENKVDDVPKKVVEQTQPEQKQVPRSVAQPQQSPTPEPVKAYKFDSNRAYASLFNKSKIDTAVSVKDYDSSTDVSENAKDIDTKSFSNATRVNTKSPGSVSTTGSLSSLGGRGLISKDGIDTSYSTPKTVVLGSMDPELLRKILREYLPQFRHCYQEELMRTQKKIEGVVSLDFRISSSGQVSESKVSSTKTQFTGQGVGCFQRVLKIIKFPKPKGGGYVDVSQPLNFYSEREVIN